MQQGEREIRQREQELQQRQLDYTAAKVELATVNERLSSLRTRHQQVAGDLQQRRQEQVQAEQHLTGLKARLDESQYTMLQASAALARWYCAKEGAEGRVAELTLERDVQRQQRQELNERAQALRHEWQGQQEEAHTHELEVNNLRNQRNTLADRLREDYQIELAQLYQEHLNHRDTETQRQEKSEVSNDAAEGATPAFSDSSLCLGVSVVSPLDPAQVNEEIAELRRKLNRLGSVNLDSLQELAELETRAATLQAQFDDLTAAKRSLEEIINKINSDSRRLFSETFATIRTHFQELFRKLFGGGMADVVLEDESDILECGIEINARPPGKELRSISLMSGGEKTLTAVALLLAIFRSKPSPFCILDEVDAALDEANIERFTGVLREFLDRSQFILITHSKKTMACADVLYGITMQESGISKRVAVRFEDWPDDNEAARNGSLAQSEPGFAGR
jgi:chromosome segregation protein